MVHGLVAQGGADGGSPQTTDDRSALAIQRIAARRSTGAANHSARVASRKRQGGRENSGKQIYAFHSVTLP